ncbi:GNAT family N-acetyltransferase [Domibacillus robiginosus]|uniref:GNAT family N-acetyltransferase n=1 Tax=Domibacillus robiginosus TaxID=1071054 RepID=UPI000AC1CF84|nr:GNAT family N-acetyltransferase [Domibacillus robiginosus]
MSQNFTFTHFPELHSSQLTLCQAMKEDIKDLFALYADQTVVRFLPLQPFASLKDVEEEMSWYQTIFADQPGLRWMIEDHYAKKVIGTYGFLNYEKIHNPIEIGYDLALAFWRQGIMAEALKPIIDFGWLFNHTSQ